MKFNLATGVGSVVLFTAVAGMSACQTNPVTGKSKINFYSYEEEKALGDEYAPQILIQLGGEYPDPELQRYVTEVGRKVEQKGRDYIKAQGNDFPTWEFKYYVVNDSLVNAFALPGGHIFVTRGILDQMSTEAQLAGLLGHEASHVFLRHGAEGMSRGVVLQLGGMLGAAALGVIIGDELGALAGGLFMMGVNLIAMKYSRGQESDSDKFGQRFAVQANYEANGIIELMQILEAETKKHGGGGPEFLSTHPDPGNRVKTLTQYRNEKWSGATVEAGHIRGEQSHAKSMVAVRATKGAYALVDQGDALSAQAAQVWAKKDEKGAEALYRQAFDKFAAACKQLPNHALPHRKAGETAVILEDNPKAIPYLEKARSIDGADFYEDFLYGIALHGVGRFKDALVALDSSLKVAGSNLTGLMLAGDCAEKLNDKKRAYGYYAKAWDAITEEENAGADAAQIAPLKQKVREAIMRCGYPDPTPPAPAKPARAAGGGQYSMAHERVYVTWGDNRAYYRILGGIADHDHGEAHEDDDHDERKPGEDDDHAAREQHATPRREDGR